MRELDSEGNPVEDSSLVAYQVETGEQVTDISADADYTGEVAFTNIWNTTEEETTPADEETTAPEDNETEATDEETTEEVSEDEDESSTSEDEEDESTTEEDESTTEEDNNRRGPIATGLQTYGGLFAGIGIVALIGLFIVVYLRRRNNK